MEAGQQRQCRDRIPGDDFRPGQFHGRQTAGTVLARIVARHRTQFDLGDRLPRSAVPLSAEFMAGRTEYFDPAQFRKVAAAEQAEIGEIAFFLRAELRQTGQQRAAFADKAAQLFIIFRNERIPAQIEQQPVLMEKVRPGFDRDFVEISERRSGEKVPLPVISLAQGMSQTARHQHIQQLAAFLRLAVSPFRQLAPELAPHRIMRILFPAADETVERRGITPFQKGDRTAGISLPRMRHDEMIEVPEHIPFAARQGIIPALAFLFPHHEQTVFLVEHIGAHHPALIEREEEESELVHEIRLHGMLGGDMDSPGTVGHRLAGCACQ